MYNAVKMRYSNHNHSKKATKRLLLLLTLVFFTIYNQSPTPRDFFLYFCFNTKLTQNKREKAKTPLLCHSLGTNCELSVIPFVVYLLLRGVAGLGGISSAIEHTYVTPAELLLFLSVRVRSTR